jgi:tRNA (cmo5U34)-methyltransferase
LPGGGTVPRTTDEVRPGRRWAFDEEVTRAFDDMLERSIPQYRVMRAAVRDVALAFLGSEQDGAGAPPLVLDLGCSRGEMIALLQAQGPRARYIGVDLSDPMLTAARERFAGDSRVEIGQCDLTRGYPRLPPARVTLSVLTLQFIPIEHRQRIVRQVYEQTSTGGCFILVEKVLGETAQLDDMMVARYLDMKRANGYSEEQITRKRLALEGVLVPMTARANEELLATAGFEAVDCFWRWMNFAAWVAVRTT